ncbi:MAG: hypothetical protein AAF961_17620, partial [Planctomycetota bacterium]
TQITADVRETNLDAQLFLRSQRFRALYVRRGYYDESGEDAYRMVLHWSDAASPECGCCDEVFYDDVAIEIVGEHPLKDEEQE